MADIDVTAPGDTDVVSNFPSNERDSRAALLALLSGTAWSGGTSGGSGNAQTVTVSNTGLTLTTGLMVVFIAGFTNTGAVTLTVNALAATTCSLPNGTDISGSHAGAITAGNLYVAFYDGSTFLILNASGYRDQKEYDLEYPVGSTILRRTTTTPTVPFGVTATWTRTTTEAFLRIEGGTPTTGGGDTATTSSGGSHTHSFSDTTSAPSAVQGGIEGGSGKDAAHSDHTHTVSGTTGSGGAHTHTVTAADLRFRSYAVWERTA